MAAPKNPKPYKGEKLWRDAILRAVNRRMEGNNTKHLELLADKIVAEGLAGNIEAIKEIGNRLDGKPVQPVAGDDDAPPLRIIVETGIARGD